MSGFAIWRQRAITFLFFGVAAAAAVLSTQPVAAEPSLRVIARTPALAGTLAEAHFLSATLGHDMTYRVYLPPDYATSQASYPVVYMLHGAGGNYTEWGDSFLPERADELIRGGEIQPMIVAMPDGGNRTYWANLPDGTRWADYLAYDVVQEIDSHYRTVPAPTSRAVGGLSMGGLGALNAGLSHPDIFGVVGGHSPSIRLEPDPRVPDQLVGAAFNENNPIWLIQHRWQPSQRLAVWVDVGLDDGWRPNIEVFGSALSAAGISSTWQEFPGKHEDTYWTAHVPDYLRFYSSALIGAR